LGSAGRPPELIQLPQQNKPLRIGMLPDESRHTVAVVLAH